MEESVLRRARLGVGGQVNARRRLQASAGQSTSDHESSVGDGEPANANGPTDRDSPGGGAPKVYPFAPPSGSSLGVPAARADVNWSLRVYARAGGCFDRSCLSVDELYHPDSMGWPG